ncbi:SEC23-interacting protein isoform 1 [Homo sapiens]|uniref:SEC23-interacting protein n=1 Tax=Homo sapiens TaxID=9606 RepID=S23IP_HUMAN|nr:SEC23-interacting protein isoform 1 [Homo sapiens]XP_047280493.1 SEC23-interacting protein isoform X1 [Homo sapiens]Q9Y6Y8.1 RecName: Full=SEC23-interacting protein; AltName: Full=p125 [Homo sapiens]AAH63800.1 SEC23 interacting protein [Homo sapiens]BAA77392.1 phospholipase [Homo sapiens]|eukprot:NP_009121.1 SEC23-interacting protein [Homo sapiens]
MAERKPNGGSGGASTSSSGTNLLFSSSATEFSFNVPFIPVTQASASPASLLLPGEDSTDVGEEDSFLGQTSIHTSAPQTFSYFSQVSSSSDPFGNIGQSPLTTAATSVGQSGFPKPLTALPFTTGSQDVSNAFSPSISKAQPGAPPSSLMGINSYLPSQPSSLPPSYFGNQPQGIPQPGYNPYRHTPGSSRANPYIAPPQLQQCQTPGPPAHPPPSGPPVQMYQMPPGSLPPVPSSVQSPAQQQVPARPGAPSVQVPSPFLLQNQYEPVQPHWFYCKEVEYKQLWMPFSVFDSLNLEEIYNSVQPDPESVVLGTDGGRYDVYLYDRIRKAAYWEEEPAEVRRCTWFYKGDTDSRFIPYTEEFSEKLEAEYKKAVTTNQWHRRLEFPSGETIVMHNPKVIVQFQPSSVPDEWGTTQDGQTRPRVVKRGIDDNLDEIPDGEMPQVDHLVFVVHGIGPVCDLRFRSIIECVDDFRVVSLKLLRTHFKKSLDDGKVSRVEFLPVHWHSSLGGDATGVDRNIKKITLPSIGRFRHFTNETLLDILFYNSPTYCQTIVEKVGMEINHLHALFMSRNPDFKGGVSVAGHSLGSLILFDILSNQKDLNLSKCPGPLAVANGVVKQLHFQEKQMPEEPKLTLDESYDLVVENKEVLTLQETLEALSLSEYFSTFEKEKIDMESLLMCTVDDLKEMGIPLGPRKKIANFVEHKAAKLKKAASEKKAVAATSTKGQEQSAQKTKDMASLPSESNEPKRKLPVGACVSSVCVNYESFEVGAGQVSVAYNSLDFEPEIFFALGSPIAMFLTIRGVDRIDENYSLPTCKGFFNIYHPLDPVAYRLEPMIVPDLDLKAVLIPHHKGRKRLHLELKESLSRMGSDLKQGFISSLKSAWQTLNEFARAHTSSTQLQEELEKVANQIKEEEEKQVVEAEKVVESPDFSKDEDYLGKVGMLNGGRRIDYVLQEKPIESFNEYLFALQSHLCYWESEDTALLLLKEIYRTMNISPEQPQH